MSVPPNMPWNWYSGPAPVPNQTPPFRPDGGMEPGPSPPTEMSDQDALKAEQGYYGPPVYGPNDAVPLDKLGGVMPEGKREPGKVPPKGKLFVDRIEDNGMAVLLDGEQKMNMRAMPGWKEGQYVDPPKQGKPMPRKKRPVP